MKRRTSGLVYDQKLSGPISGKTFRLESFAFRANHAYTENKNDATVKIDQSLPINLAKPTTSVTRCEETRELAIKNFAQT